MRRLTVLIAVVLSLHPLFSQELSLENRVDRLIEPLVRDNLISGTVLIGKGDRILFQKGYGPANREWDMANSGDTVFRLGSVSKQFTAMGILILAEEGKIRLDDPLSKYIEGFPNGDRIPLHTLLNHTSGVANYNQIKEYGEMLIRDMSIDQVIDWFKNEPPVGGPGEKFSYSNSGYVLLAAVIEKVSGRKYEEFLNEKIFKPLKMERTGQDVFEHLVRHRADGYACYDGEIINAPYRNLPFTSGAGSLCSTVEDLFKWTRGVLDHKVIGAELSEKMFTPGQGNYGYGWFIRERFGRKLMEHAGAINGFGTQVQLFPQDDVVVISLYNFESAFQRRVDESLGAIALGLPTQEFYFPQGCAVSDTDFDRFSGTYSLDEKNSFTIVRSAGKLSARFSDGREYRCLPQSPDVLLIKELHMVIQPVSRKEGAYDRLLISTGLHRFMVERVKSEIP